MADKIIVVREKRRGCGCGTLLLLAGLVIAIVIYTTPDKPRKAEAPVRTQEEKKPIDRLAPPERSIVDAAIYLAVQKHLHNPGSYERIGTTAAYHKDGYFFIHEFRARNAFNALVRSEFGLLYTTNDLKWSYCPGEQLPAMASEIVVDPELWKRLK